MSSAADVVAAPKPATSWQVLLTASCLAGSTPRIFIHPLDTLKSRIQHDRTAARPPTMSAVARLALRTEGIRGVYRGVFFTCLCSMPASCLYFGTYETAKTWGAERLGLSPTAPTTFFLSGLVAETASCMLYVPIDVVKERMQVAKLQPDGTYGKYDSGIKAIARIVRDEGVVRGLYSGYGATIGSFGPFSGCYFTIYEALKRNFATPESSPVVFWALGGLAGGSAAFITNPLDLVKLRMQTTPKVNGKKRYPNLISGLITIVTKEEAGFLGLFRGSVARVAFSAPATALSMCFFETFKRFLTRREGEACCIK